MSKRKIFFHPILFGLYPLASLLANNLDQIRAETALRAGLISLVFCAAVYLALRLALKDAGKAAVLASFWLLLFFTYGHVYGLVEGRALLGFVYGKHRYLALIWLALLLAGSLWAIRRPRGQAGLNTVLNVVSLALIAFPIAQIGLFEARTLSAGQPAAAAASTTAPTEPGAGTGGETGPDIYYIVLDGYSRADVMESLYGLDIRPFMQDLESIGFVFPNCTQSNYGLTAFSIFASLNMNYLDTLGDAIPIGSERDRIDYLPMRQYLQNSQVRQYLHERGYNMVTFETGYWWLEVDNAETYIVANNNPLIQYSAGYQVSNFEEMYLRTTALRVLSEANAAFLSPLTARVKTSREHHYDVVRFALDELDKVPALPGKKFVYFHILAPHDPFVLAPDGSYVAADSGTDDIPGYPNEVSYLNTRLAEIVRSLIAQSATPPIIILQGDHGWDPRYRMEILNGYYLPGEAGQKLYPTITPVNSFRLILNEYFGGSFPLLDDVSYYSMGSDFPQYGIRSRPYQLTPVPATCIDPQ